MEKQNSNIPKLKPDELEAQLQTVLDFLTIVHPSLVSDDKNKSCVELRPIVRGEQDYKFSRPCNIWDLSEKNLERVRKFLKLHNGAPTCLFYSVFTYDNNMKIMSADGTLVKSNHITKEAAKDTNEIVLDFDHIGFEEYTKLVDRFESLGLYALWVSTGHGYHAHLLLREALTDKNILKHLVYKFRAKGFDCDTQCVDPARVMRLPGTFNKKYLKDAAYAIESVDPPKCEVYQDSTERYDIEFILDALEALPTVSAEDEKVYLEIVAKASGKRTRKTKAGAKQEGFSPDEEPLDILQRIQYPYIQDYDFPEAIQRILTYTPHGFRNQCLGFLIKFLKKNFRFGKAELLEILTLWSEVACDPAYEPDEFKRDFSRLFYKYNGLSYTPDMIRQFGAIDFDQLIKIRKQDILIPNKLFRSFQDLDGTAVRVYLGIKMLEHQGTTATQAALSELLSISTRALRPSIQALERTCFAYRVDGNRKLGIPFSYKTSRIINQADGYMRFSYNDIRAYVTELYEEGSRANGALKLFLFFHYKFYTREIFMSQSTLAEYLGVERTSISKMVDKLEELHFIKVRKVRRSIMESCEYTLLR